MTTPVPPPAREETGRDEFFVGWLAPPRGVVRFLRPVIILLLVAAGSAAATFAFVQRDPGTGRWDSDEVRSFEGIAFAAPYAMLRMAGPGPDDPPRTLLLAENGKFGALPRVERLLQGRSQVAVRVAGTLLHRDGRAMLELATGDDGIRPLTDVARRSLSIAGSASPEVVADEVSLAGEIIDPKCYLGAMKPGGGKTHKACAMLCVAGGVPPMLVTRDAERRETFYLLTTSTGDVANDVVLPFVGDAVVATGRLERRDDLFVLYLREQGLRRR